MVERRRRRRRGMSEVGKAIRVPGSSIAFSASFFFLRLRFEKKKKKQTLELSAILKFQNFDFLNPRREREREIGNCDLCVREEETEMEEQLRVRILIIVNQRLQ